MSQEILNYTIKDISLADISYPKDELRSRIGFEDLDELARSIRAVGLMNPITARAVGDKYELIAGYRRVKACEIANLATIPCRVVNSDDDTADMQRLHENMFREAVNPIDEAQFFKKLLVKHNWRIMDLSVQIHKSPSYVSKRVQLLDADPVIISALQDQQINLSIADELNRIDDPDARQRLLYYAINSGATVETVRLWRIQYETDKGYEPPPYVAPVSTMADAPAGTDPQAVKFGEEPLPNREIQERIIETRPCYACLTKVDVKDISTLYFCSECLASVEQALRQEQPNPEPALQDTLDEVEGENHCSHQTPKP